MSALDYFLKANLYGLLFAGCYWLFLRKHTFLKLNRAYLLLSAVGALALPLASLPARTVETTQNWPVPVGVMTLPVSTIVATPITIDPPQTGPAWMGPAWTGPAWTQTGFWLYGLIALALLLRLAIRLNRLIGLIRQSDRQIRAGYVFVLPSDQTTPTFSFFHYILLNPDDTHNDLILHHELVHVRQHHSADVLALAILRSVFWPVLGLAFVERALRHVHEFLADKVASDRDGTINQPAYARFLVEYTFGVRPDVLTNGFFNPSLLKQRILMLHQRTTSRWALSKYTLVLPLTFALLAMTTAREEIAAVVTQAGNETITVSGRVTDMDGRTLPGAHVLIAGTKRGISTDPAGRYELKNVPKNAVLAYSFIGHRTDLLQLAGLTRRVNRSQLTLNARLKSVPDELPAMGATAAYKAVKPNPAMPVRVTEPSATINGEQTSPVEEPAAFPTGVPGLMQYIAQNLQYPAKARAAGIEGDVYVLFTVSPTGAVNGARINQNMQPVGGGCEEEAVRVVSRMPGWIPARQHGKPVTMRYMLPVRFALEKKEDKRTGKVESGNTKNHPYALYSDVRQKKFTLPDSNPTPQKDSSRRKSFVLQPFRLNPNKTEIRNPVPQLVQQETAELLLVNGTKQVDRFEDVNPDEIDFIEVHKGEEMKAKYREQYGDKVSKGVVIIHLKSAKSI